VSFLIEILIIVGIYLFGGISLGYYAVRHRLSQDIRNLGSGSVGARNVGRFLGWRWMLAVFLADFCKGALVVGLTNILDTSPILTQLAMVAVVIGHIWPVQLSFRGGRGIATTIGAMMAFDYLIVVVVIAITALIYLTTRKFTIGGLLAVSFSPLIALLLQNSTANIIVLAILVCILLFTHRRYIYHFVRGYQKVDV